MSSKCIAIIAAVLVEQRETIEIRAADFQASL